MRKLNKIIGGFVVAIAAVATFNVGSASALNCNYADVVVGSDVKRCLAFTPDTDGGAFATARIEDHIAPTDHWVAVSNIKIQKYDYSSADGWHWVEVKEVYDYDGWWEWNEEARVEVASCSAFLKYRAAAKFSWKQKGSDTVSTDFVVTPADDSC